MKQKCLHLSRYQEDESTNISGLVKVQSILCKDAFEDSNHGFKISEEDLSHNCLVIVTVYAKGVNRGITSNAIVVVYIKL